MQSALHCKFRSKADWLPLYRTDLDAKFSTRFWTATQRTLVVEAADLHASVCKIFKATDVEDRRSSRRDSALSSSDSSFSTPAWSTVVSYPLVTSCNVAAASPPSFRSYT